MFALPPDPLARAWLAALAALWAALLFGGFAFGRADAAGARRMPAWTRVGSSLALVAAAGFALPIALGMTLGCIGDLFLAGWLPLAQPVLGGIVAFGAGHMAYIAAILWLGGRAGLEAPAPRLGALLAWLAFGAAGWYLVVFHRRKPSVLRWAALPYALLLASMAGVASGLALQAPALVPLAAGGALFLLSDLILAGQLFSGLHFPLIGDVIWLTYGPAQLLIVYATGLALPLLAR